jgi:hypothetical protein
MSAASPFLTISVPDEQSPAQGLAKALVASAVLHALALGWPDAPIRAGRLPTPGFPTPLLATLVPPAPQLAPPLTASLPPAVEAAASVGPKVEVGAAPLTLKARFAQPPDLSAAEAVPLTGPARLHLRIQVSPQGRPGRTEILESLRVPPDFLAAVSEAIAKATFLPAETQGAAIASTLELIIEASPTPDGTGPIVTSTPRR